MAPEFPVAFVAGVLVQAMSIRLELAFDLTSQPDASRASSLAYEQALEMCAWADRVGFHAVSFGEHHCNSSHYLSPPLVMGAAASALTHRTDIRMVLVAPFYSPLRLAEDLAVLTLSNRGRTLAVLAAGYRHAEFDFHGVSLDERSASIDEKN
ncbi:MAG: LLM class flavin-dependent oxidoreductase [Rhodospirillaceae bacterium]|nr:LLM class flavin-dependent oxidoreductase [Rhodospirillaceae bacterium]